MIDNQYFTYNKFEDTYILFMKYLPEKEWEPFKKEETSRNIKREKKKFFNRIQKKSTSAFKHIWNNLLTDKAKDDIYRYYEYHMIGIEKDSMDIVLKRLISNNIIKEEDAKFIKRKWIISKLFGEKLAN